MYWQCDMNKQWVLSQSKVYIYILYIYVYVYVYQGIHALHPHTQRYSMYIYTESKREKSWGLLWLLWLDFQRSHFRVERVPIFSAHAGLNVGANGGQPYSARCGYWMWFFLFITCRPCQVRLRWLARRTKTSSCLQFPLSVWCSPWWTGRRWVIRCDLEATCLWRKLAMTYDESSLNLVTSQIHWLNYWTPWSVVIGQPSTKSSPIAANGWCPSQLAKVTEMVARFWYISGRIWCPLPFGVVTSSKRHSEREKLWKTRLPVETILEQLVNLIGFDHFWAPLVEISRSSCFEHKNPQGLRNLRTNGKQPAPPSPEIMRIRELPRR